MISPPSHSSHKRVAVTALGVVSPLGVGAAETLSSLRKNRDCVQPVTAFDVSDTRSKTAGHVPPDFLASENRRHPRLHPAAHMLSTATQEALVGFRNGVAELFVAGTTSGGMSFGEQFFRNLLARRGKRFNARLVGNYMPQKPVLDALDIAGLRIPIQIIANACATGTNAIGHAFTLVRSGRYKAVLAGGYDALSELVFVGFDALQASTPEKIRPFDATRSGLVLGEGAAVLALEEMEQARNRGARILGEVTGYGVSTDNYHLTQPHPSGIGPKLAMQRAISSAGRQPDEIDYVNAHGTATHFNDATEGAAISEIFGDVAVSSTKSMMGHCLGAAGAVEAALSLLALQHQFLPPNINTVQPDPQNTFSIVANQSRSADLHAVISNSFGFGGTNAAIVLERTINDE
ncbi:MAG TPA: beta-ketoacyl-[acyl-carrier-protein] synthase family protein [Chthoniobacterales bacterium]